MTPMPFDRRLFVGLGLAALAVPARGQGQRRPPPSSAAPFPCPHGPEDVVGIMMEGSGAPAGTVVVFGQAFRPGDLPKGSELSARTADGHDLPVQTDVATRHPDGSARFAIASLGAPALRAGEKIGVLLARRPPAASSPLDAGAALAGRQAVLELQAAAGGESVRIDLLALFRAGLAAPARRPWQAGPLALQLRVGAPVPAAVAGVASLRVVADVALRSDGTLWVDAWLCNDIAMRPDGGTARYAARLSLDGRELVRTGDLQHFQYTRWGRLAGAGPGPVPGAAPGAAAPRPLWVQHDAAYLAETGAVAAYDVSAGVAEELLAAYARLMAEAAWMAPFSPRGITQYMPQTGGRADIGPATQPQAAWLISGNGRAGAYAVGQAEAAGGIPWHFWDPAGGADGQGGWLDVRRWPRLWTDPRGGPPPTTLVQPVPGDTGWGPDIAHQPDLSFVPALLTGRRVFLDGVLAQAAYNIVARYPAERAPEGAPATARDVLVVNWGQVRGSAWAIRQLDEAGWIAPDADANRSYLAGAAAANWAWLVSRIPVWGGQQGEAQGWLPGEYRDAGALPPWQQDYLVTSSAAAAQRGNPDARTFLQWQANFVIGRFQHQAGGFDPHDGTAYHFAYADPAAPGQPYRTWAEMGAATTARGWSTRGKWSEDNSTQLALASLALVHRVLGQDAALTTWRAIVAQQPKYTSVAEFQRQPAFNIVPRGVTRGNAQAVACTTPRR